MTKVLKAFITGPFGGIVPQILAKKSEPQLSPAQAAQQRQAFATQEDNAQIQADQAASGRLLRQGGRRALAFQGSETGAKTLAPTLAG